MSPPPSSFCIVKVPIAHCDLKPENVLCAIKDFVTPVKLCDLILLSSADLLSWDLLVWSTQLTLTKHHWWSTISQNLIYDIIYLALILKATKCLNRHHVSLSQNTIPKVYQKKLDFLKLAEFNKFYINLKLWIIMKIRILNLRSCCLFQTLLSILMPNIHHLALNT